MYIGLRVYFVFRFQHPYTAAVQRGWKPLASSTCMFLSYGILEGGGSKRDI